MLLRNAMNPRVRPEDDRGPVPRDSLISHMSLGLRRNPEHRAALDRLLEKQQDPSSPDYHQWLTPEEFGARFGADENSLNRLSNWLRFEGFRVEGIARGRGWIVFSGTAAQVESAFHTQLHQYRAGFRMHFAAAAPPSIPAEFESLVAAIRGLDDFYLEAPAKLLPMANLADGSHALAPGDIDRIYNLFVYYTFPSSARSIAVVGNSAIDLSDIRKFQSTFQLPAQDPQTILVGDDPGVDSNGGLTEADADIEWAGAVARNATIVYVYAKDVMDAAQQAIDQNVAPILSFSFGNCESNVSPSDSETIRDLAQQANAQGITWITASGDAGAAACDQGSYPATQGLAVSFPASLPEVTGVGGTEFTETGVSWRSFNSPDLSSAYAYIPEAAWNDSSPRLGLRASGGGTSELYPKPSWQTGPGVPDNGARNVPDLALSASSSHDPYIVFTGGKQYAAGGTSLAAPVFAGIMALIPYASAGGKVQGFGNINPSLYAMAANNASNPFHDITSGNNIVPCGADTPDCVNGSLGYSAGPGYDLVTGLGSLDAQKFIGAFGLATVTTLNTPATTVKEGATVSFRVTVKELTGRTPTGSVILNYDGPYATSPPATLDASGTAVVTTTLTGGPHSVTATYVPKAPL